MFEDSLQVKLKQMEKTKPSPNLHTKGLKEYLLDRYYFSRRYLSNCTKQIPQKDSVRRSVRDLATDYAEAMGIDPGKYLAYLEGAANAYGCTLEQLRFHAAVRRRRELPDKENIPKDLRGRTIEWIEILC